MRQTFLPFLAAALLAPLAWPAPAAAQQSLDDWAKEQSSEARYGGSGSDGSTIILRDGTRSFDEMMEEQEKANEPPSASDRADLQEENAMDAQRKADEAAFKRSSGVPEEMRQGTEATDAAEDAKAQSGTASSSASSGGSGSSRTGTKGKDEQKQVRQVYNPTPSVAMPRRTIRDERIDDGYVQSIGRR